MTNKKLKKKTYIVSLIILEDDELTVRARNKTEARKLARKIMIADAAYDSMEIGDIIELKENNEKNIIF